MDYSEVTTLLTLSSEDLLKRCRSSNYQSQGAGGQKRNKVKSGIRLTLTGTSYETTSCEQRSPKANTVDAVRKLKISIALGERHTITDFTTIQFPGSETRISIKNPLYYLFIKQVLDVLVMQNGELKATAQLFKLTSSALNRIFHKEKKFIEKVQEVRRTFDLPPLKR
ncbi:MAG: hypothetical protein OCC49_05185 [Fibrobacterales bacterium]